MKDLFEKEQRILDTAIIHLKEVKCGSPCTSEMFEALVDEYGRLLKQIRRFTKISDRTTIDLNTSKLDLIDKVHYDALTGIYNRRYLEESLARDIKSVSRAGGTLSVLMMDVDHFKKFNDTYGHGMGDDCLKSVAEALKTSLLRPDDFVARYGGEEFIAVLPNTDEEGARVMAERMIENVRSLGIPHEKNDDAKCVTISIGGTCGNVIHSHNGEAFIQKADKALYLSKRDGRNRYTYIDFQGEVE